MWLQYGENMDLPRRKQNRLKNYDYSNNGAYFITICTQNKQSVFWKVGATNGRLRDGDLLSEYGRIVENAILNIPKYYKTITVEKYVIMPNHIHMILLIQCNGSAMHSPTVSTVIQQFKGHITKQIKRSIWQKSFHDHIIRNEQDYNKIWEYIDNNPKSWCDDCFYVSDESTIKPIYSFKA